MTKFIYNISMKQFLFRRVIFFSLILVSVSMFSFADLDIKKPKTKKIDSLMLVGNSFFYYNNSLHNHLGDLIKNDTNVNAMTRRSITINGSDLPWHDIESYLSNEQIGSYTIDADNNNNDSVMTFDLDGSEKMRINTSGHVTTPNQPYFRVTMKYLASNAWNGTAQTLDSTGYWNNPTDNVGSHWSSSTGKFTAPVAGKYLFTFNMRYDSFSGSYFHIDMRKNGSVQTRSLKSEGGSYLMGDVSHIIPMAASDYMDIKVFSIGDNSVVLNNDSYLSGMLLG